MEQEFKVETVLHSIPVDGLSQAFVTSYFKCADDLDITKLFATLDIVKKLSVTMSSKIFVCSSYESKSYCTTFAICGVNMMWLYDRWEEFCRAQTPPLALPVPISVSFSSEPALFKVLGRLTSMPFHSIT
jgi:hypothetical protein